MKTTFTTVEEYLEHLPDDRREVMKKLVDMIRESLPSGFSESISYGMPGWGVPHSLYPAGYHCDPKQPLPFLGLASTKGHISLYHMGLYAGALLEWLTSEWNATQKVKLDMGKGCIRFRKPDQIPFGLLAELLGKITPQDWINLYEQNLKR